MYQRVFLFSNFIRYILDETRDTFVEDREVLESVLGKDFLSCLERKREGFYLDLNLNTSERQCQEINNLLLEKKNYFSGSIS